MRDLMAEAWRSLSRRSLTSVLAIVSVAIGVSAYLCVVSLSESLLSLQYADLEADPLAPRPSITVYPWLSEGVPVLIDQREVATSSAASHGPGGCVVGHGVRCPQGGAGEQTTVTVRAVSGNTYRGGFGSESSLPPRTDDLAGG